jgi:hypothetical protein
LVGGGGIGATLSASQLDGALFDVPRLGGSRSSIRPHHHPHHRLREAKSIFPTLPVFIDEEGVRVDK